MRLTIAVFALLPFLATISAAPVPASAAPCAGATSAAAVRDKIVDDKVHSAKLTGAKATAALDTMKAATTAAQSCLTSGSTADRAANLAVIAQLRWDSACVLEYDGVPADKAAAVKLAKTSDRDLDAFETAHASLSDDARALFGNWQHFNGDIESGQPDSCLES